MNHPRKMLRIFRGRSLSLRSAREDVRREGRTISAAEHLESYFAAWMRHDPGEMAAFYTEDAVMEDPTLAEPRRGRAAVERYYADMFATLERPEHALRDWAVRGDRVWFEWTFRSGGETKPCEDYLGVSIQRFRDGLIVHDAAFWVPGA